MTPVQPTLTITIEDVSYDVANMSDQVRQMVSYMDDWRQKEVDLSSELLMARSALRDIQNTMLATIRQEQEAKAAEQKAAEQAAVELAPVEPAAAAQ